MVSRHAVVDIVRTATLGSYGVTGFATGLAGRIRERLGLGQPGIRVGFGAGGVGPASTAVNDDRSEPADLTIDLDLTVAYGVPVAEVARQVDSAVRYALRRALGHDVASVTIHVDGLELRPGQLPEPRTADPKVIPADDLAASGTDVA
jgi:uncharacterized alkaline shock family protein YloU